MMQQILSIQSAVTLGAVGNTMASLVFASSRLQFCRVDTIQLTAHPGHGLRAGGSLEDHDFADLLSGLNHLGAWPDLAAIMTGYVGRAGQIVAIRSALEQYRRARPDGMVLVDPAMGDHGRLYVDPAIANGIATSLLPLASLTTPNAFELGWLTGRNIDHAEDAAAAAAALADTYPNLQAIAATGIAMGSGIADMLFVREQAPIWVYKPSLGRGFPGGGDLFTALLTRFIMDGRGIEDAFRRASENCGDIFAQTASFGENEIDLETVRAALAAD